MVEEVPFTDVYVDETIVDRAADVVRSKRWVKGPEVEAFETEFASAVGTEYAVGVSSGTAALLLALDALGVGRGDEVFIPGHTFFATASPVLALGATPVFVDVDEDTYTIDPGHLRERVEAAEQPAAVLPVHIYGQIADMESIRAIAEDHDLQIVEDACQAHLAERDGQHAGTFGDAGCFSFYPSKNMAVGGDGGMIVTDDSEIASTARALKNHGRNEDGEHVELGLNYRLDEFKGAIGREQLTRLPEWSERRAAAAERYDERLEAILEVVTPSTDPQTEHVYHLYVVQVPDRDELARVLDDNGVDTSVHYETPAHRHEAITERVSTSELPITEALVDRILSLPMHPRITSEEIDYVCDVIENHYATA